MRIVPADRMAKPLGKKEVDKLLSEPNILRLGLIDDDGSPIVHPVWYCYRDEKFYVAIDMAGRKARLLKKNPKVYFLVDVNPQNSPPKGVRGKGIARVIEDTAFAEEITAINVKNYLGSTRTKKAQEILKLGKRSCVVEIAPSYLATWKF